PKASGALPKKGGTDTSQSVSTDQPTDPHDTEKNIQLAVTGLHATNLDEGTRKSQPFPEGTMIDPQDSEGNTQLVDKGLPSMVASHSGTSFETQPSPAASKKPNKSKKRRIRRSKPEPSPEASKKPKSSPEPSDFEFSLVSLDIKAFDNNAKHEEVAASYNDVKATVEEYAEKNDYNRNQTKKAINNIMEFAEKINKARVDERITLLKYLSIVSETLEADSALKETMQSMT
ncbi:hypothetical protein Tco_1366568, partial [Tanacetum coccineum]